MHTDLQVSAARSVDRMPEVCGVADHGAVDLDPGPVVAQARLLLGLTEREALADLKRIICSTSRYRTLRDDFIVNL